MKGLQRARGKAGCVAAISMLLGTPVSDIGVPGPLIIPASCQCVLGVSSGGPVVGSMPHMWESWSEIWASGFSQPSLASKRCLEINQHIERSMSFSLSLCLWLSKKNHIKMELKGKFSSV